MAGRIGNVIYWFFCVLATIAGATLTVMALEAGEIFSGGWLTVAAYAGSLWLIGRVFRYILSGN